MLFLDLPTFIGMKNMDWLFPSKRKVETGILNGLRKINCNFFEIVHYVISYTLISAVEDLSLRGIKSLALFLV